MQRYRVVIMLVLFGVLPVVAAFFLALSFLGDQEPEQTQAEVAPVPEEPGPPPPPETREVLAAARALPVGTLLGEDDLSVVSLDSIEVADDYVVVIGVAEAETFYGHAVREALTEGTPLSRSAVVGPDQQGFLAAVLKPGTRAVTVRVGPATRHAGLIDPGDRVDVILTAELAVDGTERNVLARTIVEDVRVVATDHRVGTGADPAASGAGEGAVRTEMTTATLEARPAQARRLVLGEHEGTLSLAVRSLAAAPASSGTTAGEAADLREMLLSSSEFSAAKTRQRRVQELNDLSVRTQIVESEEQLREAVEGRAANREEVRIIRGSEPVEEVAFKRR